MIPPLYFRWLGNNYCRIGSKVYRWLLIDGSTLDLPEYLTVFEGQFYLRGEVNESQSEA